MFQAIKPQQLSPKAKKVLFVLCLLELLVFFLVAKAVGVMMTLGLTLLTSILGFKLLKRQGLLQSPQTSLGSSPKDMALAILRTISSVFLILPGFITDFLGLLLLIPGFLPIVAKFFARFKASKAAPKNDSTYHQPPSEEDKSALEGEYWRED